MKVIENNYKSKTKPVKNIPDTVIAYCDNCDSKLEITEEDTHIGWLGARFVTCPCCGQETMLDEVMEGITLTVDNIEFPVHFNRTNKNSGAVEIPNEDIVKDIRRAINYFRTSNDDDWCWFTEHGEVFVAVYKLDGDDEYYVVVSKDYYSTYIPFADEDKESEEDDYV